MDHGRRSYSARSHGFGSDRDTAQDVAGERQVVRDVLVPGLGAPIEPTLGVGPGPLCLDWPVHACYPTPTSARARSPMCATPSASNAAAARASASLESSGYFSTHTCAVRTSHQAASSGRPSVFH